MHFGTMITRNTGKHTGGIGMTKHTGVLRVLLTALVVLLLGIGAQGAWADDDGDSLRRSAHFLRAQQHGW